MLRAGSWSRSSSFWGTSQFKPPNGTLGASSEFDQQSMIALGSSRTLDVAEPVVEGLPTIRPECELGLGCMYSSPSHRFSALHTFQSFGNSEKPPRNNGLRGALSLARPQRSR